MLFRTFVSRRKLHEQVYVRDSCPLTGTVYASDFQTGGNFVQVIRGRYPLVGSCNYKQIIGIAFASEPASLIIIAIGMVAMIGRR